MVSLPMYRRGRSYHPLRAGDTMVEDRTANRRPQTSHFPYSVPKNSTKDPVVRLVEKRFATQTSILFPDCIANLHRTLLGTPLFKDSFASCPGKMPSLRPGLLDRSIWMISPGPVTEASAHSEISVTDRSPCAIPVSIGPSNAVCALRVAWISADNRKKSSVNVRIAAFMKISAASVESATSVANGIA